MKADSLTLENRVHNLEAYMNSHNDQIEILAENLQKLHESVDSRFDEVDKRFDRLEKRFDHLESNVEKIMNALAI